MVKRNYLRISKACYKTVMILTFVRQASRRAGRSRCRYWVKRRLFYTHVGCARTMDGVCGISGFTRFVDARGISYVPPRLDFPEPSASIQFPRQAGGAASWIFMLRTPCKARTAGGAHQQISRGSARKLLQKTPLQQNSSETYASNWADCLGGRGGGGFDPYGDIEGIYRERVGRMAMAFTPVGGFCRSGKTG